MALLHKMLPVCFPEHFKDAWRISLRSRSQAGFLTGYKPPGLEAELCSICMEGSCVLFLYSTKEAPQVQRGRAGHHCGACVLLAPSGDLNSSLTMVVGRQVVGGGLCREINVHCVPAAWSVMVCYVSRKSMEQTIPQTLDRYVLC